MTKRKPSKFTIGIIGEITEETAEKTISSWVAVVENYRPGDCVEVVIGSPGGSTLTPGI